MSDFNPDLFFRKYRKLRIVMLVLLPLFMLTCIAGLGSSNSLLFFAAVISLILMFIDIGVVIALLTRNYTNWIIAFLVLVIIGIYFRHNRWPLAGALFVFGFGGLGSVSLFSSVNFFKRYRHNPFLRYIGFSFSIVLFIVSIGLLWKNQHWPLASLMLTIGMITFIPFLFAFVFTLPNSNYINWTKAERIIFFKAIILPMIFVYSLSVMMFVFPEFWLSLTRSPLPPFGMGEVQLLEKVLTH